MMLDSGDSDFDYFQDHSPSIQSHCPEWHLLKPRRPNLAQYGIKPRQYEQDVTGLTRFFCLCYWRAYFFVLPILKHPVNPVIFSFPDHSLQFWLTGKGDVNSWIRKNALISVWLPGSCSAN